MAAILVATILVATIRPIAILITAILSAPISFESVVAAAIAGKILVLEIAAWKATLPQPLVFSFTDLLILICEIQRRWFRRSDIDRLAEIRENILRLNLAFTQRSEVVGYRFRFVQSNLAGVGAHKSLVEDPAG